MSRGFMGKTWDGGDVAFQPETWAAIYRVLKPGAHLLAFGGTRTYHRLACAIEDAGFECRDMIAWMYGSGFPKSHDVSKAIDKRLGAEREVVGKKAAALLAVAPGQDNERPAVTLDITAPATDLAAEWSGWGSALKPAIEPICLARKPLSETTIAANVLRWGTGALNIDGCRVATDDLVTDDGRRTNTNCHEGYQRPGASMFNTGKPAQRGGPSQPLGRWPANVIHDGSDEVVAAFPAETGNSSGGGMKDLKKGKLFQGDTNPNVTSSCGFGDSGSAARFFKTCNGRDGEASADRRYADETGFAMLPGARRDGAQPARFFYTAKADGDDRLGSRHPTVKPLDLIRYLVRLVTPKGGTVLDPFAGTGTIGEAAWRAGFEALMIERETEYQADIRRRMALALAGPEERARESVKARGRVLSPGPLFDGWSEAAE
jgi:site-specific DNA-methyltransferase (adenine-specific)